MYTVTFEDGSSFEGGSPAASKWSEIPDKAIKSIEYSLTPFIKYLFIDFEAYNHCVERVRGVNKSFERINKVIIMGKTKGAVHQILLDKDGNVFQVTVKAGQEYSPSSKIVDGKFAGWEKGKPLSGWKQGSTKQGSPKLEKIFTKR